MSTAVKTAVLPTEIRRQLGSARTRLRAVDLSLGLARGALGVAAGLLLLFCLDIALEPPLAVVRTFALFVAMLAGLTSAYWITRPMRRRLQDDDVALLLEKEFPHLQGGLVSSVQLVGDTEGHVSRALVNRMIERTAVKVARINVGEVFRVGPLIPLWGLIFAFVLLAGGIANSNTVSPYTKVFWQRVIHGEQVFYPKLVGFEVRQLAEVQLAKGEDLDVDVAVTKGASLLERLEIITTYADGREERRDLLRKGDLLFSKAYQNVTEPFRFRVISAEHRVRSPDFLVKVIQRPRVEQYEFLLRYPDYVGRPPEVMTQPDLSVPAGTEVTYAVVSNKSLAKATLFFDQETRQTSSGPNRGKRRMTSDPGPTPSPAGGLSAGDFAEAGEWAELAGAQERLKLTSAEVAPRALVGRFTVTNDMRFRFDLVSAEGLSTGDRPVTFSVRVVRDRRPVVSIPVPGKTKQVTPQAKVDLKIKARDDYGIAKLELHLQPVRQTEAGGPQEGDWIKIPLNLPPGDQVPRKVDVPFVISLADYRLAAGDQLNYKAVAFDHNQDEKRNFAPSRVYSLQITPPEDLERVFQEKLAALKERLMSAGKEQEETQKETSAFVSELGPKSVLSEDDKRRVQRLEYDQRRITTKLTESKKALEALANERKANRLTEPGAMSLLRELAEGVQKLSDEKSPQVQRQLSDARKSAKLDSKTRNKLAQIPDRQGEVADELRRLATRIDKYGDFTEVLQEVRDLLKGEERIIEGAKKRAIEGD